MNRFNQDVFIGLGISIFSILFLIKTGDIPDGASLFPIIVLSSFGLFGLAIALSGFRKRKTNENEDDEKLTLASIKLPMYCLFVVIAYVILIDFIGFFVSTALFIVSLMLFYKIRSIKVIALTAITLNLFIYILFVVQLNLRLPQGILF